MNMHVQQFNYITLFLSILVISRDIIQFNITGLIIQQNDHCEFNDNIRRFGTIKQFYLKDGDNSNTIYCAVQWFFMEENSTNTTIYLYDTDYVEMDVLITNIVKKIVINSTNTTQVSKIISRDVTNFLGIYIDM